MQVESKRMQELRVATVAHRGAYDKISAAFAKLGALAGPAGLIGPQAMMLGLYYDDPATTPTAELRSAAAITVAPGATIPAGLVEDRIAGGRYAVATHVGSYEGLGAAWNELRGGWLKSSGERRRPGVVSFEIYRNMPGSVPPEKLVTELYLPLADR